MLRAKNFYRASSFPFTTGCLVVVAACLVFFSFGGGKPRFFLQLDNQITDIMLHWRGPQPSSGSVVVVDIDEKSLAQIGQWPWPRTEVARLLEAIAAQGPKAIAMDMVFAEVDRTSPRYGLDELEPLLLKRFSPKEIHDLKAEQRFDHDVTLGSAIAVTPTILGYVFQVADDGLKNPQNVPFPSINLDLQPQGINFTDLPLPNAYRAIVNVPAVSTAQTEGFFNVIPDSSGTVRKVPLFMACDGVPYPSLALEVARIGLGINSATIHVASQSRGRFPLLGVSLGGQFIPTDSTGQLTINFRGPGKSFPYYSAADVLKGRTEQFKDKYVLVGTSAAGLHDLRATPFGSVVPGVEIHASVVDNILSGDSLRYDIYTEIGLTYTAIIVGGVTLAALLSFSSPLVGGLGGMMLIVASLVYGTYQQLFLKGVVVGVSYPLLTLSTVFVVVTLFNYFIKDREKRFIQGAFSHYVSPQVVQELVDAPEKLILAGEERELTIFFNDIRGFTTISESMSSPDLARFLNEYLSAMSDIIMAHQGTVDKYIGDAIMAIWGAPLSDQDHAIHALRAAMAMRQGLRNLQPEWCQKGLPAIEIGVGINTGRVSVGNFGSSQRFDYTVIGDNVNLASRLEGLNKLYGTSILISESTHEAVKDLFYCHLVDTVRVKGRGRPVAIYQPLCEGEPSMEVIEQYKRFEQGIRSYQELNFTQAREIFLSLRQGEQGAICDLYLRRIEAFIQHPPPSDWDGVFTAVSK